MSIHTCSVCGCKWVTGGDGRHSCAALLAKELKAVKTRKIAAVAVMTRSVPVVDCSTETLTMICSSDTTVQEIIEWYNRYNSKNAPAIRLELSFPDESQ